jgi:hypothetical protein
MGQKTDPSPDSLAKGESIEVEYGSKPPHDQIANLENGVVEGATQLSKEEETRILRKVDYRLVPLLAFLYLVAFVDRSNSKFIILGNPLSPYA